MTIKFLEIIQGKWKYQATTHIIKTKRNTNYTGFIQIQRIENNKLDNIEIYQVNYNKLINLVNIMQNLNNITIHKICENRHINYKLEKSRKDKIFMFYENGNMTFEETIHLVNINFFFIVGVLKKNNNYRYISVTSYIKVI